MQSKPWCYNVEVSTSSFTSAQSGHIFQRLPWQSYFKIRTSWCISSPISGSFSHQKKNATEIEIFPIGIEAPDKGRINRTVPWQPQRQGQSWKTIHVKGLNKRYEYEQRLQELKRGQINNQ